MKTRINQKTRKIIIETIFQFGCDSKKIGTAKRWAELSRIYENYYRSKKHANDRPDCETRVGLHRAYYGDNVTDINVFDFLHKIGERCGWYGKYGCYWPVQRKYALRRARLAAMIAREIARAKLNC